MSVSARMVAQLSGAIGYVVGLTIGTFVIGSDTTVGLVPLAPCVTEVAELRVEDEICTTWEVDGRVVVGPLWLK